jgi:hypothetical protein
MVVDVWMTMVDENRSFSCFDLLFCIFLLVHSFVGENGVFGQTTHLQ